MDRARHTRAMPNRSVAVAAGSDCDVCDAVVPAVAAAAPAAAPAAHPTYDPIVVGSRLQPARRPPRNADYTQETDQRHQSWGCVGRLLGRPQLRHVSRFSVPERDRHGKCEIRGRLQATDTAPREHHVHKHCNDVFGPRHGVSQGALAMARRITATVGLDTGRLHPCDMFKLRQRSSAMFGYG